MEERDGGLVGFELRDASRAGSQVTFQVGVHLSRQMMLDEVGQEPHKIGAAAFVLHRRLVWTRGTIPLEPPRKKGEGADGSFSFFPDRSFDITSGPRSLLSQKSYPIHIEKRGLRNHLLPLSPSVRPW